jgi:hypothetical protein
MTCRGNGSALLHLQRNGEPLLDGTNDLIAQWMPPTCVLNKLNRGQGLTDALPFVLPAKMIRKLRFVCDTLLAPARTRQRANVRRTPSRSPCAD